LNPFTFLPPMVRQTVRWEWQPSAFGWLLVPVMVWSLAL